MGSKHPDQIAAVEWRRSAETVELMLKRHWEVISTCRHCGLIMLADLRVVAVIKGREFSLWNRHARCRRMLCPGIVDFSFKAPGMTYHRPLAAPWPDDPGPRGHIERAIARRG